MHNKLVEILEELKIDVAFQEYTGYADEYIIFNIYKDEDSDFVDNINLSETYYISINYWFKSKSKISKYKIIKDHLKKNGFTYDGGKDLKGKDVVGRNLDFIYMEILNESEEI